VGDVVNVGGLRGEKQFVSVGNDVGRGRWLLGGGINAHRLMLSFISKVRNNTHTGVYEELDPAKIYYMDVNDFSKFFDLDKRDIYKDIREIVDSIYKSEIVLHPTKKRTIKFRWVTYVEYNEDTRVIGLRWSHDIIPYISQLTANFHTFKLSSIRHISSVNALRLYEILIQRVNLWDKGVYFDLDNLKYILCLEDKYDGFAQFRQFVLGPSLQQINVSKDIIVSYTVKKKERKVIGIQFDVRKYKKSFGGSDGY